MTLEEFMKYLRSQTDGFERFYSEGVAKNGDEKFEANLELVDWMEQFIVYEELQAL